MTLKLRLLLTPAVLLLFLIFFSNIPTAAAHEHREIKIGSRTVELTVGWIVEPAFVDQKNAVDFRAALETTGGPVYGLDKALKVEVSTGSKQIVLSLEPVFRRDGAYQAHIIPTVAGSYAFRFFGNVNGTAINERFECSEKTFDCVDAVTDIQFPEKPPSSREIQQSLAELRTQLNQLNELRSQLAQLRGDVQTAYTVATLGVIVGIIGIGISVVRTRKKSG